MDAIISDDHIQHGTTAIVYIIKCHKNARKNYTKTYPEL